MVFKNLLSSCEPPKGDACPSQALEAQTIHAQCLILPFTTDHRVAQGPGKLRVMIEYLMSRSHFAASLSDHQPERQSVLEAVREGFITVVGTCSKLRELESLLSSILSALDSTLLPEGAGPGLLRDPPCYRALARTVQDCPPPQFEPIWEMMEGNVAVCKQDSSGHIEGGEDEKEGKTGGGDDGDGGRAISDPNIALCQVELFACFLQNLRISSTNAAALCERVVSTTQKVCIISTDHQTVVCCVLLN